MTVAEILANEELRAHEFPVVREKIFLAHAAVCPLPRRVAEAVAGYARVAATGDQERSVLPRVLAEGRELGARLLGAQPDEVSFVGPTSLALSLVAGGMRCRRHDNILVYHDDYPSNVYPWMALADKGVQVRLLNVRELGGIRNIDVLGQVDEQTRLVALASCHFVSGARLDHATIGKNLRTRGILFCLDGIQTLGAFPTEVGGAVDFLAADAHKWLLGPCAAGLLYVRQAVQERVHPAIYGWHNVRCPNFVTQDQIELRTGAARFEAGSHNLLGLVGLHAAMELLLEVGVEAIAAELLRKRAWLIPALQAKGYTVMGAHHGPAQAGGIISCRHPAMDLPALHARLDAAGVVTSLRQDRAGNHYLRLSPHFYNTDAELHRVLELL